MSSQSQGGEGSSGKKPNAAKRLELPPAALRALAEAEARRTAEKNNTAVQPVEIGGRGGKDPVRYGDWEVKGRAADF